MKEVKEIKGQIRKFSKDAKETAKTVKDTFEEGVRSSKDVANKAGSLWNKFVDKKKLKQGLDITSKGVGIVAKGARLASKGATVVADNVEKASKKVQDFGNKLKD